jgi:hypothetical protein
MDFSFSTAATSADGTLSVSQLNATVRQALDELADVNLKGKKAAAAKALVRLTNLLCQDSSRTLYAAQLHDNRLSNAPDAKALPTWGRLFPRVLYYLKAQTSVSKLKTEAEKLRVLLGAAEGAGPGALTSRLEIRIALHVVSEVCEPARAPFKPDGSTAHAEYLGVLLHLVERPGLVGRLTPARLRSMLDAVTGWITCTGPAAAGGGSSRAVAGPSQMLQTQYMQLLTHLLFGWSADMPLDEARSVQQRAAGVQAPGPLNLFLEFFFTLCENGAPHLDKIINNAWQGLLQACGHHTTRAPHARII